MGKSWNDIRSRATTFAKEREKGTSEDVEAKSFWVRFIEVFAVRRRRVALLFEKYLEITSEPDSQLKAGFS